MKDQEHPVIAGFAITVVLLILVILIMLMFYSKWGFE